MADVDEAEIVSGGKERQDGPDKTRPAVPVKEEKKKKFGKGSQRRTIIGLEVRVEVVLGGITQTSCFRLVIIRRARLVLLPAGGMAFPAHRLVGWSCLRLVDARMDQEGSGSENRRWELTGPPRERRRRQRSQRKLDRGGDNNYRRGWEQKWEMRRK